jgi:hypothetical protein
VDSVRDADAFTYDTTQIRPAVTGSYVGDRLRTDLGVASATIEPATDATPGHTAIVTIIVGKDLAQSKIGNLRPSRPPSPRTR